ncbi:ATP-binding cassette domain-containing protein [Falsiroseomonas stagni]|uniref:ABC-type bacteriocin/lantibiotic exporter, contains an N-terminal double-glycine peptidase domain n=1 Tax=Falsiroseomonas stagni DSM 19981 TaxID=1123062 RepID=A0A1I4E0H6_9PROT|nr:ATP-binding cassette domain-containing protein [Falsiroseomonas stagni]SFK99235.1 ABC-type bacteriocin/lantibiotic exporter, contains an N-terminal double-glycine peptidase domain [Falsiroseomonas stagni DSM 19981]
MDTLTSTLPIETIDRRFQQPPRSLAEPGAFWVLEGGEADLFAAVEGLEEGVAPPGPYLFVGRLEEGSLVVGHESDIECLVIRPAAGAVLRRLPQLHALGGSEAVLEAMQGWAGVLAQGLGARLWRPSNIDRVARPGRMLQLADRQSATTRGAGAWLRLPAQGAMLLGLEPVSGLLPLPPQAWIVAGSAFEAPVFAGVLPEALDDAAAGIAAFTQACVAMLPGLRSLAEIDESGRLEQRARQDREAESRTAGIAAALLHAPPPAEADPGRDEAPLFLAMVAVAKAAGLRPRITRPIRLREQDIDTPPTMEEIARASGLRLRQVALPGDWWKRDLGPLLGREEGGDAVALLRAGSHYAIHKPGAAAVAVTEAVAGTLEARAWTLIEPLPDQPLGWAQLQHFVHPHGSDKALAIGAAVIGAFLGLGMPVAMSFATGSLIPGGNRFGLVELGIALACVGLANFVVQMAGDIAKHRMTATMEAPLHAALWDRLLRLPIPVLRRHNPSDLASRLGVALAVPLGRKNYRLAMIGGIATFTAAMAALFAYIPMAAVVALPLILLQLGLSIGAGILKTRAHAASLAQTGAADALAIEAVSGITKLRLAGVEQRLLARWAERFMALRGSKLAEEHVETWHAAISAALTFIALGLLFVVFAAGDASAKPAVVGFLMAFMIANGAASGFGAAFMGLHPLNAMRDHAAPLMQSLPEATAGRIDPGRLSGHLSLSNVAFAYEGAEQPVFRGLELEVEAGEFVAIIGRSGCGKSTLVRLLLGLERPHFGSVAYDGQDLASLDLGLLRRRVGTVLQGATLPPGALIDTLRGFSDATEAQIWAALEGAAIAEDVRAMPLGLRTPIADASQVLSGGQVQRLLLARALVNRPDVLILDEATSALDPTTQAVTTRTVAGMTCTRIVIAHRLETIRGADRIVVIEEGRVAHAGRFEELVEAGVIEPG